MPRCIQLYNNLTGEKKLKWFERVADQVVTLGLHYVRKLTNEEILVLREKLSPHRQGWTGHLCDLENHRTAGTPGRPVKNGKKRVGPRRRGGRHLDSEAYKCRKLTEMFSSTEAQPRYDRTTCDDDEGQRDELVPQTDTGQVSMEHERGRKGVTCLG